LHESKWHPIPKTFYWSQFYQIARSLGLFRVAACRARARSQLAHKKAGCLEAVKALLPNLGYGHAEKSKLPMAWLQNKSGEYVKPSLESGQATLNSVPLPENLRGWIPDPEGKDSYPIVTYTWLLVHKHHGNPRTAAALKDVLKYCVTDGQKDSVALGYIPLPEKVRQAELQALDAIAP
jgi:hypothetical protein